MAKRHYDFWTKFSYSGYSEKDWKKDDPSPFSFFFQKVKFWGLIFQSGPRNRESTFWKTAAVKSEKVKFLPFCHRTLRSDWSTRRNWTNSFYFLHRKRSSKFMSYYLTKWLLQKNLCKYSTHFKVAFVCFLSYQYLIIFSGGRWDSHK